MSKDNDLAVSPTATPRPRPEAGTAPGTGGHLTDHAFFMRWSRRRSWQGLTIADRDEIPAVRPTSSALHHGQGVFDDLKAYRMADGTVSVFRPDSHIKRLNNGARRLALPLVDFDRVWHAIRRLVELDADWLPGEAGAALHLRAVLAGNGTTIKAGPAEESLFFVLAGPSAPEPADGPVRAMVVDGYIRARPGGTGDINAVGNQAPGLVPREIAANYGYDHVLWLGDGPQRLVQQIGAMNVFFVVDGVLTTPALDGTVLPGITRDSIVKLARDAGTTVAERPLELAEVLAGIGNGRITECFGTSTVDGVVSIGGIGFQAEEYRLPGGSAVADHFRQLLDGLHRGELVDRFGWMRRLTEVSPVHA
ncbi:aminotransferase class IV [Couchioplanes azureus]|uniref:aminotransferase class IV n=1 Tax=Couchioplanes caeruleus TaxID=56438 RepID=UPI00167151A8|nr:aminotransferase class IV [Couchioplanes caeruleus]GGQ69922.1 branched-chain-amino-acid aminotransferase [Couchioplanes caeruleus subsp. azureus]